jgi:hypothetical protein
MKKILILFSIIMALSLSAWAQNVASFAGSYEFSEDGGRNAGGTAIYIGHDLTVNADGSAKLTANGYQTSKSLLCYTKATGNKLLVYFDSYHEDDLYKNPDKKTGDLLLTLEKKKLGGKLVVWTYWGKYEPIIFQVRKKGGVYFKKLKN